MTVEYPKVSDCNYCTSDFDGGKYWNRTSKACSKTCVATNYLYNFTSNACEVFSDKTNCPVFHTIENIKYCTKTCNDTRPYLYLRECLSECPKAAYIWDMNKNCVNKCPTG